MTKKSIVLYCEVVFDSVTLHAVFIGFNSFTVMILVTLFTFFSNLIFYLGSKFY